MIGRLTLLSRGSNLLYVEPTGADGLSVRVYVLLQSRDSGDRMEAADKMTEPPEKTRAAKTALNLEGAAT